MKLTNILVNIVVVTMVITGIGLGVNELGTNYGKTDTIDTDQFDKLEEIETKATALQDELGTQTGFNPSVVFDVLNFIFFDVAGIFLTIPDIITSLLTGANVELGAIIPAFIIGGLILIVMIIIVMKVAGIVFRRDV